MSVALLHFEPCFSTIDQSILLKRTLKKIKKNVKICEKSFPLYLIPVYERKPSEKAIEKFIAYLKEEKVEKILLSDRAMQLPCSKKLTDSFSYCNGTSVIIYMVYDILKKYAAQKNIDLSESTVILCDDQPEIVMKIILKLYKYVKKIKIKTENPKKFEKMIFNFLYEYGLMIEICKKTNKKENEIFINTIDHKNEVMFFIKNIKEEYHYHKSINQSVIEFLAENFFNGSGDCHIKAFVNDFSPRIIKIKNND